MKNKKGFTLIELMIIMAIIGILAAIIIPKFAEIVHKNKIAECRKGNTQFCDGLTDAEQGHESKQESADATPATPATAAPAKPDCDFKTNPVVRGVVKYVNKNEYSNDTPDWDAVIQLDNGTSFSTKLSLPVIEGVTVCLAVSPDRSACWDRVVVCP